MLKRVVHLSGAVGVWLVLWAGCISVPSDIDAGGCIRACNNTNTECLGLTDIECTVGDTCFDELELCFDRADECAQACTGCEDEGTCPEGEAECSDACTSIANGCTDLIDGCIELKEDCIDIEVDGKEDCFEHFVECTATCIDDVEQKLKDI